MDFGFTKEEEAFRKEVQDFLDREMPPDWLMDMYCDGGSEEFHQLGLKMRRKLAAKGWIGLSWPKEYGGQGAPLMKQVILEEELIYNRAPFYYIETGMVGPLILQFGNEEQKKRFLPPITRGEVGWCIGMSEPNAGSDLAALETRAVEEKDCFVLSGQKTWQSETHHANWSMVYARTDPNAPKKHRGISCFLVDLKSPGITTRFIEDMSDSMPFNEVFYGNVKVPKENLLGGLNGGWSVALGSIASDRTLGLSLILIAKRGLELLAQYCRETYVNGQPLAKDPVLRNRLAEMAIEIEAGRNLGYRLNWMISKGMLVVAEGSQIRVLGGYVTQHLANLAMQILGLYGQLDEKSKWARLSGRMKINYLRAAAMVMFGGTTEVSKNTIASFGLGLPRG
jgi:alkylation response protein AidB-like acyl-CoA dehydrogenase